MGKFEAFYVESDGLVEAEPAEQLKPGSVESVLPETTKYYVRLFRKAFSNCYKGQQLKYGELSLNRPAKKVASELRFALTDRTSADLQALFEAIINYVANEEDERYYVWKENRAGVKDQGGKEVLNNLMRVNAFDLRQWFTKAAGANELKTMISQTDKVLGGTLRKGKEYCPIHYTANMSYISLSLNPPPPFYVDPDNLTARYEKQSDGTFKLAETPTKKPPKHPCFYYVDGTELKSSWVKVPSLESGSGGGAMRADKINEVDYIWTGNQALGIGLGLSAGTYIKCGGGYDKFKFEVDTAIARGYDVTNVPYHKHAPPQSIPVVPGTKRGRSPKQKATPQPAEPALVQVAATGFMGSEILYLKRFKKGVKKKKNSPENPNAPRIPLLSGPTRTDKGVRNLLEVWRKKQKGDPELESEESTGLPLSHSKAGLRSAAGQVMSVAMRDGVVTPSKDGTQFAEQFSPWLTARRQNQKDATSTDSSLAATDFARFVVEKDELAKGSWKENSLGEDAATKGMIVRTDQEWCHLYGHGDGGTEVLCNFVSGSKHCNTEQLAIECGQRKNRPVGLSIRVTAYLLKNRGGLLETSVPVPAVEGIYNKWQLPFDLKSFKGKYFQGEIRGTLKLKPGFFEEVSKLPVGGASGSLREDLLALCQPYPLANWVRYKIYFLSGKTPVKIFDHIFDAQSMSFNYHEFKILKTTVERVIAFNQGGKQAEAYKEGIDALILKETNRPVLVTEEAEVPMDTDEVKGPTGKEEVSEPVHAQGTLTYRYDAEVAGFISQYLEAKSRFSRPPMTKGGATSGSSNKRQRGNVDGMDTNN